MRPSKLPNMKLFRVVSAFRAYERPQAVQSEKGKRYRWPKVIPKGELIWLNSKHTHPRRLLAKGRIKLALEPVVAVEEQ